MSLFLSREDVAELTGITRKDNGKTREQLQCEFLRSQGIQFFVNFRGEPKVTIAFINGSKEHVKQTGWQPKLLAA